MWLALGVLAAVGCIRVGEPPANEPQRSTAPGLNVAGEHVETTAEKSARIQKTNEATAAAREAAGRKLDEDEAVARRTVSEADASVHHGDCEPDRALRMSRLEQASVERARRDTISGWESEHCALVDRGKPEIHTMQDSRGRIYQQERVVGGVHKECDAKRPPGLVAGGGTSISRIDEYRNAICRDEDVRASSFASAYWANHGSVQ